jgi:hypothetical protein
MYKVFTTDMIEYWFCTKIKHGLFETHDENEWVWKACDERLDMLTQKIVLQGTAHAVNNIVHKWQKSHLIIWNCINDFS